MTNLHRTLLLLPFVSFALALSGCGSTSEMKRSSGLAGNHTYTGAVVSKVDMSKAKTDITPAKLEFAAEEFTRTIAGQLQAKAPAANVRIGGKAGAGDLLIDTIVTEYIEGNAVARLMIGLGAGNSNIEGTVAVRDAKTGTVLGTITIDRYGWVLGGGLAATQTVETFHKSIAIKIAENAAPLLRR